MYHTFQNFKGDKRANIALLFGLLAAPVIFSVGMAVDYSLTSAAQVKLQQCSDNAVLFAVAKQGMTDATSTAETKVRSAFLAMCDTSTSKLARVAINSANATVTDANGARTAVLNYQAERNNYFLMMGGFPKTPISGSSTSNSSKVTNIDIYALLDNSPSMGLAATTSDQVKMRTLTPDQCEFACHIIGSTNDYWKIARNNSVTMRIDVLRDGWKNLITNAQSSSNANQFRFATYTFNSTLNQVQPLTGSYTTALSAASSIDLVPVLATGPGSTYTDSALAALTPLVPVSGDGSTPALSKKYLIFVTDGVQDFVNPMATFGHQTQTITSSSCNALKAKGVQVAVIYTTYLALPENTYQQLVKPFAPNISPSLSACASSTDLFFEADQASDIQDAFTKIFSRFMSSARLTQ